jgi:hypothetical protein
VYQKVFSSFFGQTCDDAVVEEQLKKLEKVRLDPGLITDFVLNIFFLCNAWSFYQW